MNQPRWKWRAALGAAAVLATVAAGCSTADEETATSTNADFSVDDWASVEAAARGQTVRWYMWGGSDSINRFVDETYAPVLKERYDITMERVPVEDTVDAVNQVLAEKEAGKDPGAVDLIWINGENFQTLRQADLLRKDWATELPNAELVAWDDPALNRDFGVPVDGMESPWSSAQFQFVYDTTRTQEADLPRSYAALKDWACANPGRFTYIAPGPGAFQGTRFAKAALFELSGGAEQWADFDQSLWDEWSPKLWAYLDELAPCLWQGGTNYPKDEAELHQLFANNEVDFTITQAIVGPSSLIEEGLVPETSKAFTFDQYSIGDFNYVAIPSNAPSPAAALVLANLILDPDRQALQIDPSNGFGLGYGIDISKVTDADARAVLDTAAQARGVGAATIEELDASRVADAAPEYQELVEQRWRREVVGGP
jgi:putative spermidine/putrescine transport system substrate-binding protein